MVTSFKISKSLIISSTGSTNNYLWSIQTNKKKTRVLFHAEFSKDIVACFDHSRLFKVKMCLACKKSPNKRQLNTILYFLLYIFHSKLSECLFGNTCITLTAFHKKNLSVCPVDAILMAVDFLYSYVDINLKNLKKRIDISI
jgi:hypothetical protein